MEPNAPKAGGSAGPRHYHVADKPLFLSGLMFLAIAVGTIAIAWDYPLGSASEMGPGYFPIALAVVLGLIGAISTVLAVRTTVERKLPAFPYLPTFSIAIGVLGFGILLPRFGLVLASLFLLVCITYQRIRTKPIEFVVVTAVLIVFSSLLFVEFLGIPLELWP